MCKQGKVQYYSSSAVSANKRIALQFCYWKTILSNYHKWPSFKWSPLFTWNYAHICFFFKSVHIPLLLSLPPADTHVDDLVAPHASCKSSWQTTDGCLWSNNNEQPRVKLRAGQTGDTEAPNKKIKYRGGPERRRALGGALPCDHSKWEPHHLITLSKGMSPLLFQMRTRQRKCVEPSIDEMQRNLLQ